MLDSDEEEGLLQGGSNPGASPEAQQEPAAVRTTSGIIATRSRAVSAGRQLPGKLFAVGGVGVGGVGWGVRWVVWIWAGWSRGVRWVG